MKTVICILALVSYTLAASCGKDCNEKYKGKACISLFNKESGNSDCIDGADKTCKCVCESMMNDPTEKIDCAKGEDDGGDDGGEGGGGGGGCFTRDAKVITNSGEVSIQELAGIEGVDVLTMNRNSGQLEYSPITMWLHAEESKPTPFVRLTADKETLVLSDRHLIYISDCLSTTPTRTIYAKDVRIGDCILTRRENSLVASPVKEINIEYHDNLYAFATETGSVIVSNVAASCFAAVPYEEMAQVLAKGYLFFRNLFPSLIAGVLGSAEDQLAPIIRLTVVSLKHYMG